MSVYVLFAVYTLAVCVVLAALFLHGRRLRVVAALVGALALWLPFSLYKTSLGRPTPFVSGGNYEVLGLRWNPSGSKVFVLVNDDPLNPIPRLLSLPWDREPGAWEGFDFDESAYGYIGQTIQLDPGGTLDLLEMPYQAPDWDKDKWYAENRTPEPIREPLPGIDK